MLAAAGIRLLSLDQSLWLDEAISASVTKYSYVEILTKFAPTDFHPPVYYWILRIWTTFFGRSEVAVRFPSIIFSLVAGYAVYQIGKLLKNETIGTWAAVFFLFNPLIIYYSQEARMYALATMSVALNLWLFLRLKKKFENKIAALFVVTTLLCLFSFYGTIFYLGALGLYSLWEKDWKLAKLQFLASVGAVVILSPLLSRQWFYSREVVSAVQNWGSVLGSVTIKNVLLIPIKLTSGRVSFDPKLIYYSLAGLWLGIVATFTVLARREKLLVWLLAVPVALGTVFSFFSPLLQYFRFIYLIIPLAILLAIGTEKIKIGRIFIVLGLITWSLLYLLLPRFHREDWQSLSRLIDTRAIPVYMVSSSSAPLRYYLPEKEVLPLEAIGSLELPYEILVVPYTSEIHGVQYVQSLEMNGYERTLLMVVRELSLERWTRKQTDLPLE